MDFRIVILFPSLFTIAMGIYTPMGDAVTEGSVLLPATRRGRYVANIIRRQAVDGTGIQFNVNADRMNAEAKKKVDVLSDELLPYIISEQERRTTLYKRVMTALQNGEKGVTIAEMRNKAPLIIKRGLLYRCPSNRAPLEPDGSGAIMCEKGVQPSQVMFDSCLSAEDRDLYMAGDKMFFCNRHRLEGPELPRNGSLVVGCAPQERTSLNYTLNQCALEDSDDVIVHYRYYPDKTYKYVHELDPDHEVCDHWNPCQIGYIFSLPSPDQAIFASDLWPGIVEDTRNYERDEFVEAVLDSDHINTNPGQLLKAVDLRGSYAVGSLVHGSTTFACEKCELRDVLRGGDSVYPSLQLKQPEPGTVVFSFPSFEDEDAGVYKAVIKIKSELYEKVLAIYENNSPEVAIPVVKKIPAPENGEKFEQEIKYICSRKCTVEKVLANGVLLGTDLTGDESNPTPPNMTYEVSPSSITLRTDAFSVDLAGMCQAVFKLEDDSTVTKNIFEFTDKSGLRSISEYTRRSDTTSVKKTGIAARKTTTDPGKDTDKATTHATSVKVTSGKFTHDTGRKIVNENVTTEEASLKVISMSVTTENTHRKETIANITSENHIAKVSENVTDVTTISNENITVTSAN